MANGASVSDWAAMESLVAEIVDRFGDLDGVVNNAGFLRDRMLTSMSEDDFDSVGQSNYATAKAGIAMLTTVIAMEMQRYSVTANCVSPIAATRMLASIGMEQTEPGWDRLDPANASPVVAWLCSEESGWLSGQLLRIDGNQLLRVGGYSIDGEYSSQSGEKLTADELHIGIRKLFGAFPAGLVIK